MTAGMLAAALLVPPGRAVAEEPVALRIVGGLAGIAQYKRYEEPFWRDEIQNISKGRITATIAPFDRSGLRGQDMLQLMRLGVVPIGTAILSLVAGDEPVLNGVDLPALNPDIDSLRRSVAAYRPKIEQVLRERYNLKLLGVYTYPAQVLFCARPFTGLTDLAGRRIRTSSVGQSEFVGALGAVPVGTPFAEIVASVKQGVVDCAITGTLSGYEIGLSEVTTHIHRMAISWGLSVFAVNTASWSALPQDVREILTEGVARLEARIWDAAQKDTHRGFACAAGDAECPLERRGRMTAVAVTDSDEAQRQRLLRDAALPAWIDRCGQDCVDAWNETLGPLLAMPVTIDGTVAKPAAPAN